MDMAIIFKTTMTQLSWALIISQYIHCNINILPIPITQHKSLHRHQGTVIRFVPATVVNQELWNFVLHLHLQHLQRDVHKIHLTTRTRYIHPLCLDSPPPPPPPIYIHPVFGPQLKHWLFMYPMYILFMNYHRKKKDCHFLSVD